MSDTVRIKLVRSFAGQKPGNVKIAKALGFSKMQQVLVKQKIPSIMGMVRKIGFMLEILPEERNSDVGNPAGRKSAKADK